MNDAGASAQAHAVTSGSDALLGMAALGKTAFALLLVVGLIVLCAWLVRRLTPGQANAGQHLKVIASRAVGAKERVVIVELEDTWLVLGVGNGQVGKLHERPAPPAPNRCWKAGWRNLSSMIRRGQHRRRCFVPPPATK